MSPYGRVLALQSHVVRGHVGADAFSFPLQALGLDVGCIFTCQFVDLFVHEGPQLQTDHLKTLLKHLGPSAFQQGVREGLPATEQRAPYEPPFRYIASGFVGKPELLEVVAEWLGSLKQVLGPLGAPLYVCDPVMGDCNQLYVHPECIGSYCSKLLPLADIITPNQYEAGWILAYQQQQQQQQEKETVGWSDCNYPAVPIDNWGALLAAIEGLHERGPEVVVITSVELGAAAAAEAHSILAAAAAEQQQQQQEGDYLFIVASRKAREQQRCGPLEKPEKETADVLYAIAVPKKEGYIGGAGDLFAASFTAFFVREKQHLGDALTKTAAAVQAVIEETISRSPRPQTVDAVGAQESLRNPPASSMRPAVRLSRSSSG